MNSPDFPQDRRQFLKRLGGVGAGLFLGGQIPQLFAQSVESTSSASGMVPQRKFGRHDLMVSSLALGGHALASAKDQAESNLIVDEALAHGVNFFDNCWDYYDGRAEEVMGSAIKGKRDKVFLMTKVCAGHKDRSTGGAVAGGKDLALKMLDESLARLGTDHLDLWQVHAVARMEQVERAFAPGGVVEALAIAQKQGKVKYVGFTGHTDPDVHLAMLSHKYPFDTCQLPISILDATNDAFQSRVLPELIKQGIAPLAMKSLCGRGAPVKDGLYTPKEGISYSLSLPIATLVSGITSIEQLRENVAIAANFKPMPREEMVALVDRCRPANPGMKYEMYRRWSYRDGSFSAGQFV